MYMILKTNYSLNTKSKLIQNSLLKPEKNNLKCIPILRKTYLSNRHKKKIA